MSTVDRVWKYGCRSPREHDLALQLLGQASHYADDLRRAYNADKRARRAEWAAELEAAHVRVWETHAAAEAYAAHVLARSRHLVATEKRERLNASLRAVRASRGHLLDWGTYTLLEEAALTASKASGLDPIKAKPFDGTGRIGAFVQSAARFSASEWSHPRVRLTTPNEKGHAELTIRVGAAGSKDAVRSITWPIKIDRPFPPGAVVKQVAVQRVRRGHRYRWEALITISYVPEERDIDARGVVGIDIGWRVEGNGQRVATWSASDGETGSLHVDVLDAFEYADAIRGIRDTNFDAAKAYAAEARLPGAEHARLWRAKDRMTRLASRTGDLGPVWWRERDKHLEDIEDAARRKAIGRRLDAYRVYADKLAKHYRIAALEDMPISEWVGSGETPAKERRRSTAALYLLQQAIVHRFGPERIDWVPAAYSTMTCAVCGLVREESVGSNPTWACACGAQHHQDENAAAIIRSRCERWIGDGNPPRARTRKSAKGKPSRRADGIATGDDRRMTVTAREPLSEAAE